MNEPIITIIGNLGRDPELRQTPNGTTLCNLSIGVTPTTKQNNEWVDGETIWFRVTQWDNNGTAQAVAESFKKGDRLLVTGRFSLGTYTKDGVEKTACEINADTIAWIPKKIKTETKKSGDDPWTM